MAENSRNQECEDGSSASCTDTRYTAKFEGCNLTLTATKYNHLGQPLKGPTDAVISFSLADIDPSTVKVDDSDHSLGVSSSANIVFGTINDQNKIVVKYPNDTSGPQSTETTHRCCGMVFSRGIPVRPAYAPRLAKALNRAVKLCGGKPSAY